MLASSVSFSWYWFREKESVPFYTQESDLGFLEQSTWNYENFTEEWRLFIDSHKGVWKLYFFTIVTDMPLCLLATWSIWKNGTKNLEFVLNRLGYSEHKRTMCEDLKVISMLLGQHSGYTKFPCFLCEWDSRDRKKHYVKQMWPIRKALIPGVKNVKR